MTDNPQDASILNRTFLESQFYTMAQLCCGFVAASEAIQPDVGPCLSVPKLSGNHDSISPAGVSCALSSKTSAFIDKLLDVIRIESQGASARSHLDGWQVGLALPGCVLDNPRNADAQFLCYVPRPHELAYRPAVDRDNWQNVSLIAPIQTLHRWPHSR